MLQTKKKQLEIRNRKIAKNDKDYKRIVFVNKRTGTKFMLSNKKTQEKIEGISADTKAFLARNHNRVHREAFC